MASRTILPNTPAAVRCPSLLLRKRAATRASAPRVREVSRNLGGDQTFVLIPNAGHAFLVNRAAPVWKANVSEFFTRKLAVQPLRAAR